MSAVQEAIRRRQRGFRRLDRWPWYWPLLAAPRPLVGYVLSVLAGYLALAGWEAARTRPTAGDLVLFVALMGCGAVCVEATRRLGQPSGVSRDLLAAWWLPVALLLPPVYALAAPAVLGLLLYVRVNHGAVYQRVFSSVALGLAGAIVSIVFRRLSPVSAAGHTAGLAAGPAAGSHVWFTRPQQAVVAVACAVAFVMLSTGFVAVAAWLAKPDAEPAAEPGAEPDAKPGARLAGMLWDRERLLLDLTGTCIGVLVTIAGALSVLLLCVALPPVVLLQRSLLHQQLKAAARTDGKTGLLNAVTWQREAGAEIARAQRRGEQVAVLLADVDHFKKVNDTHGHLVGDEVLRALAGELRRQVRESDLVGRFGGEEFAVMLPGTAPEEACRIAERLRRGAGVVEVPTGGTVVNVTLSVGVAVLGRHGQDLFELLAAADLALYRAKDTGRNRVCVFDPADAAPDAAPDPSRLRSIFDHSLRKLAYE